MAEYIVRERRFTIRRYGRSRLWLACEDGRAVISAPSRRELLRIVRNRVEGNPPWAALS